MLIKAGRYSTATVLTLISVGCLTVSYRLAHWWVRILCIAMGLSLPLAIARLMPSRLQNQDQEASHRSYRARLGFSYVYVVVIAIALMLILPWLGLLLFYLFGHSGMN